MASVITELARYQDMLEPLVVVTGQHRQMLDQVLRIFEIEPDYDLDIMEEDQSLTSIVTKTMQGLEETIIREKPDMILVQGDTSTTFAAGLMAYYYKIPLGHIEAGLRTFDKWRPYPEEANRRLTTVLADLHFAPTQTSVSHLVAEGVNRNAIFLTGNTVIDALLRTASRDFDLARNGIDLAPKKRTILVTAHRRENFGQPMRNVCAAIARLAKKHEKGIEFVLPVHKNPKVRTTINEDLGAIKNVKLIEPLDYEPFVHLMKSSYLILSDSGGVQEEAPSLGKPVLVLREKTERPEAVTAGTVKLVGTDVQLIYDETEKLLTDKAAYEHMSRAINPYGDGRAAERIVSAILYSFGTTDRKPQEFRLKDLVRT
jgi:UDP-N-acetylglucosamine 2-epimerase (non-hydrolysing)